MSGAILSSTSVLAPSVVARPSRASMLRARRSSRKASPCRSRRPGVLGEEMLTVRNRRAGAQAGDAGHVVGDAVARILVGADVDADDAGPAARAGAGAARTASRPSLLKPKRLITASSRRRRNTRGRGLPGCGCGVTVPISTKPKPSARSASGTSHCLSKPAARPTGLGKRRAEGRDRKARIVRGRRQRGRELQRPDRQPVRRLRVERVEERAARSRTGRRSRRKVRNDVAAVRTEGQRLRPAHGRERQAGRRDAGRARRRARARSASASPSASASTARTTGRVCPAKCRRAVSATCPAVEKWM